MDTIYMITVRQSACKQWFPVAELGFCKVVDVAFVTGEAALESFVAALPGGSLVEIEVW